MNDDSIPDAVIQNELDKNGFKPPPNTDKFGEVLDGPTNLYRHFDKDGNLLYVGISLSAVERLRAHRERSHWFYQIALITIDVYETRHKAHIAEDMAIQLENPLHNLDRSSGAPDYNLFDPDERKVESVRMIRMMREKRADVRFQRRARLKKEIEAAGMESAL